MIIYLKIKNAKTQNNKLAHSTEKKNAQESNGRISNE